MGDKEATAKVDLGLLEEDDEFEEFPSDETETKGEETTVNVWEDNWDDDKKEDDFAVQLRAMEDAMSSRGRVREREETPPPAKRRCVQATPPATPTENGGTSNGHNGASHTELESLSGVARGTRRSSRTSASSRGSSVSSPPASPARSSRRRGAGSQGEAQPPLTPTRSSGRLRKN